VPTHSQDHRHPGVLAATRAPASRSRPGTVSALEPDRWVDRHADALFRYALARLGDSTAAEDAVQEGLLAALASMDRFDGHSSERTWLVGIVRHKVLDLIRRRLRTTAADAGSAAHAGALDHARAPTRGGGGAVPSSVVCRADRAVRTPESGAPDPGEHASRREARARLRRCLDRMPSAQRQLLLLREVDGVPTPTLCEIFGVTPTNLWTMLHRAKARLRALLESESHDDPSWRPS